MQKLIQELFTLHQKVGLLQNSHLKDTNHLLFVHARIACMNKALQINESKKGESFAAKW